MSEQISLRDLPSGEWHIAKIGKYIIPRNGNVLAPNFRKQEPVQKPCDCGDAGGWPA